MRSPQTITVSAAMNSTSTAESGRGSSEGALVDGNGYLVGIIVAGQSIYSGLRTPRAGLSSRRPAA